MSQSQIPAEASTPKRLSDRLLAPVEYKLSSLDCPSATRGRIGRFTGASWRHHGP